MYDPLKGSNPGRMAELLPEQHSSRISVPEIARRLNIGRLAVYSMLEQGMAVAQGHALRLVFEQQSRITNRLKALFRVLPQT